ncbi:MAG: hypothetical protein ACETWT_00710, partial [Thermodesulfobacteriota bacterium]
GNIYLFQPLKGWPSPSVRLSPSVCPQGRRLTSKPFDFALRSEQFGLELTAERLRVEDSGQALFTLDGYPTSPADYAQRQRYSPGAQEASKNTASLDN